MTGVQTCALPICFPVTIVGQQDYRVVGDDGMSSKQEKAIKLIEKGSTLEILSEDDFLKNL